MKIKEGFIKSKLGNECVVVPVGAQTIDFRGLITLNETGEFIWDMLSEDRNEEELVNAILSEYEIDKQTAENDVKMFVDNLKEKDLLA